MQLELGELDLRYASLRISDRARAQRLVASLCEVGQQTPVLVVRGEGDRFVLIDGYARVDALRRLAHDVVEAAVLELAEAEALVVGYRLDNTRPRSALEEGWLLQELREHHGLTLDDLARKLDRSKSWVSRRLALVRVLPVSVQSAVQSGRVGAQIATMYLVRWAGATAAQCDRLVKQLGDERLSVRNAARLYDAWRKGDAELRTRVVEHPNLFLLAQAAARDDDVDPHADKEIAAVVDDLGAVAGLCVRARGRLDKHDISAAGAVQRRTLISAFGHARAAFGSLSARLEEEAH
jgi:ParB/RepB/Spo0J family partition protein